MSSNKYQCNQFCTFAAKYNLMLLSWYVKMISQIRNEVLNKAISFSRSFDIKRGGREVGVMGVGAALPARN